VDNTASMLGPDAFGVSGIPAWIQSHAKTKYYTIPV